MQMEDEKRGAVQSVNQGAKGNKFGKCGRCKSATRATRRASYGGARPAERPMCQISARRRATYK